MVRKSSQAFCTTFSHDSQIGCPVAWLLASSGTEETIAYWLQLVQNKSPSVLPYRFMTDRDQAQINAIGSVYKSSTIHSSLDSPAHRELWGAQHLSEEGEDRAAHPHEDGNGACDGKAGHASDRSREDRQEDGPRSLQRWAGTGLEGAGDREGEGQGESAGGWARGRE